MPNCRGARRTGPLKYDVRLIFLFCRPFILFYPRNYIISTYTHSIVSVGFIRPCHVVRSTGDSGNVFYSSFSAVNACLYILFGKGEIGDGSKGANGRDLGSG